MILLLERAISLSSRQKEKIVENEAERHFTDRGNWQT